MLNSERAEVIDHPAVTAAKAEKAAKRVKKTEEEAKGENTLPVFDDVHEALSALVKATQAEEAKKGKRKKLADQYADQVKQAKDSFDLAVSEGSGEAKDAVELAVRAEADAKAARATAKRLREEADTACNADKTRIGKTFSALSEVKEERSEKKSAAAKAYRKAEEKRSLIAEGIAAQAKQLLLSL